MYMFDNCLYMSWNKMDWLIDKAPNYISESISLTRNQHNKNTRSGTWSLQVPYVKSFGKTSFQYTGIQTWNELKCDVQGAISKSSFKYLVKKFLFKFKFIYWQSIQHTYTILTIQCNIIMIQWCWRNVWWYDCRCHLFMQDDRLPLAPEDI